MPSKLNATHEHLASLLAGISAKSVELWIEGERLSFRDPAAALSDDQVQALRRLEPELVAELRRGPFITQTFPLTYGQKSLWFMHQTMRTSPAYNVGLAVSVHSPLDVAALRASLQTLLDRHAALRSVFKVEENGELCQQVLAYQPLCFEQVDCPGWPEGEVRRKLTEAYRRPFDLAAGPLLRTHLYSDGPQRHVVLLNFHHIVFDGQSMFTFLTELQETYAAAQAGREPSLRSLKNSYREFVEWQSARMAGPTGTDELVWWQEKLKGASHVLDLPTDHPRPSHLTGRGGSIVLQVEDDVLDKLRQLAQDRKAYLYDVFLAAYQVLLYRYSNQSDLLVGFLTSGRGQMRFAKLCGLFINPVVIRALFSAGLGFLEFLDRQSETLAESLERQNYPFLALVEHSHVTRLPGCMPLVQVLFNFFKTPRGAQLEELFVTGHPGQPVRSPGLTLESFGLNQDDGEFDLVLEVAEGRRCWLRFRYSAELFDHGSIVRLMGHYQNLLRAIAENPRRAVGDLPLMDEEERARMLVTTGYKAPPYPLDTGVHQLFEEQAARTPDRIALISGGERLTYSELNREANTLAHYLRQQGVGPETLVGVCLERSNQMVVALLAILKAGGAYVPLDPNFPRARLELILQDARPPLVLTESRLAQVLPATESRLFQLDTEPDAYRSAPGENPAPAVSGSNLAYVLYTSGSTGKPKGVQIPHRAFTNFQLSMLERPGLGADDVLLAVTTISFDIAGLELFLPLIAGACVVIAGKDAVVDGRRLAEAIQEHGVSVMQATPATWRLLIDSGWTGSPGLKALCGGEALSRELANQLLSRVDSLWNMYGPTETTVWSTVHRVGPGHEPIPLGTPISNTTLYILDTNSQPVPAGVPGELCIGGVGVARGYMNRPGLTASRFLEDPFGAPGGMLYRTGDLCKYHADGSIAFLGRLDDQVKIRGHRIELGDIESALLRLTKVREAVVVVYEDPAAGKRLVAYLTENPGERRAATGEFRETLGSELPEYMIPSAFVYLESLPLTPNNKVDRKSLRALTPPKLEAGHEYLPPGTAVEIAVSGLWQRMLGVERVGLNDRFDELGGDSLAFALMIVRLSKQFHVELPVSMDDEMLSVHGLARAVDRACQAARAAGSEAAGAPLSGGAGASAERSGQSRTGEMLIRATRALLRMVARVECEGLENIPASGPLILAGNHISLFDFLVLGSVLGGRATGLAVRPAFIIADKWRNCVHSYAAQLGNPIYIRRGKGDLEALEGALAVLEAKGVVAIMPEGRPSRRGLLRAKPGVGYLAAETLASVLPLAIYGHERAFGNWARLRRVPVKIRIGQPFDLSGADAKSDLQGKADFIMKAIARLMPEVYQGVYRAEPGPNGSSS